MSNKLEFLFGLCSLLGLIVTAVISVFAIANGSYGVESNAVIISLAVINLALALVCVSIVSRNVALSRDRSALEPTIAYQEEKIKSLSMSLDAFADDRQELSDIIHSIQDQLRDRIWELIDSYSRVIAGEVLSSDELVTLERTNEMFYLFVVTNVKVLLDILTKDKCAVCIKILDVEDKPGGEIMVRTFMRDTKSFRERRSSDKAIYEYPYFENTAFKTILSDSPDSYYASDDLAKETTYININSNWNNFYNSTLVCPIRMELIEENDDNQYYSSYSVLGFICADNMKGGLANQECVELFSSIADSLYNHFFIFNVLMEALGNQKSSVLAAQ